MPHIIRANEPNLLRFGRFLLWAGLAMYVAYTLVGWSAKITEFSIDRWTEVSYIKLNRGDELEISRNANENRTCIRKAVLGLAGTGLVNVGVKVVAALIVSWL
jgi:hypothetical protein